MRTSSQIRVVEHADALREVLFIRVRMDELLSEMVRFDARYAAKLHAHDEFMALVEELNNWAGTWEYMDAT